MQNKTQDALKQAKNRLEQSLKDIEKRQEKATKEGQSEPDHLKTGISINELEARRAIKEQENEDPTE
jgi:hypothetical protein